MFFLEELQHRFFEHDESEHFLLLWTFLVDHNAATAFVSGRQSALKSVKGTDPGIYYWLGISRGNKFILSGLPLASLLGSITGDTHWPVAQSHTDQPFACSCWLQTYIVSCLACYKSKESHDLLSRCSFSPAFAEEPYLQLWSRSHWQCLMRCCHQVSVSSLNPWAASNYGLYQEALGTGHWGREQCAWHKCQKSQGSLVKQVTADKTKPPYLTAALFEGCTSKLQRHSDHEHRYQSAKQQHAMEIRNRYNGLHFNYCSSGVFYLSRSLSTWMFSSKFADMLQKISSVSFILKLSIPLSPTPLAALFITCNHNNLSFLFANRKEFLSQGVFVPRIKRMSEHTKTFIGVDKADVTFKTC